MSGVELTTVWLFAIFCASVTVRTAMRSWAAGRVDVAKQHAEAHVEIHRLTMQAQLTAAREAMGLAHDPMFVPPQWGDEL